MKKASKTKTSTKQKKATHKYNIGDIVGVAYDCMANCKITNILPNQRYELEVVHVAHPNPEQSWFGRNPKFTAHKDQIIVRLEQA